LLRACKESSIFRLASAGYDARYDRRENVCSAMDVERLVFIAEKEIASDDRSGVRPREIRRVYVKKKMHIACVVSDAIIALC
jgi:hypothetical protein